jgi:aminoglycoside 6-adenylyltransferase
LVDVSSSIVTKIVEWAKQEQTVKAVILQGSHATNQADRYSDYDLSLFCTEIETFTYNDTWLSAFGNVWICVHEKLCLAQQIVPTRLVIFEDGIKVDFTLFSPDILRTVHCLPPFKILVDKENMLKNVENEAYERDNPSLQQFVRCIKEFWFEAYHVAIALKREDLWNAKFRFEAIDAFLLQMIEWHASALNEGQQILHGGKWMRSWVTPCCWEYIQKISSLPSVSWERLDETMQLFRLLATETAFKWHYLDALDLDFNISHYISSLKL